MDWGLVLTTAALALVWVLTHAVTRWIEVRQHLMIWGPGDDNEVAPATWLMREHG